MTSRLRPRVYLETTIISYLAALPSRDLVVAAHQRITKEWWTQQRDKFSLFVSTLVAAEAEKGDANAVQRRLRVMADIAVLEVTGQCGWLAERLVAKGGVPAIAAADALHVAVVSISEMDFLLTWNCAHINNAQQKERIRAVCEAEGRKCPVICTPEELPGA